MFKKIRNGSQIPLHCIVTGGFICYPYDEIINVAFKYIECNYVLIMLKIYL